MIDYILLTVLFIYLISFLGSGMEKGLEIFTVFFMILLGIGLFGYSLIQLNKQDPEFLKFKFGDKEIQLNYGENTKIDVEFSEIFILVTTFIGNTMIPGGKGFFLYWILFLIIGLIGYVIISSTNASKEVKSALKWYLGTTTLSIFAPLAYTSFKVYE